MALRFNALLQDAGLELSQVRLLRHETHAHGGRTPYVLWRDNLIAFDDYQRIQKRSRRGYFAGSHWASFVVDPAGATLFVGIYEVSLAGEVPSDWVDPLAGRRFDWSEYELYDLRLSQFLAEYIGRLVIDWGAGTRQWSQLSANQDKIITELRRQFIEPQFPGFDRFISQLSELEQLPSAWKAVLSSTRGIYLLTCPTTKEQYVGSATGAGGFLARWMEYAVTGHGGNVALKSRDPSDYRISILQTAGSAAGVEEVSAMETLWKQKLQSREMGLNRN